MRNKLFLFVAFALILMVFLYAPLNRILVANGVWEMPENRNTVEAENVHSGFLSDQLNGIENAKAVVSDTYINYLPFYVSIVSATQTFQSTINKPTYDMLSEIASAAKNNINSQRDEGKLTDDTDNTDDTDVKQPSLFSLDISFMRQADTFRDYKYHLVTNDGKEYDFFDRAVSRSMDETMAITRATTANINRIAAINEDINAYVYIGTRLQDTELAATYFPDEICTKDTVDYMKSHLDEKIQCDSLPINTIEDRVEKLFFCDHHWNAIGANEGYTQILDMMRNNYPDIGEPSPWLEYYTIDDIHYCGSFSESVGDYSISDAFSWYDYALKYHVIEGSDGIFASQTRYLDGEYEKRVHGTVMHYERFYGDPKHICYTFNKTGRNLLMICDSYAKAIAEPMASHFDNTYLIYPWDIGVDINYEYYIEKRNITDVLFVASSYRMLGDIWNDLYWERIK